VAAGRVRPRALACSLAYSLEKGTSGKRGEGEGITYRVHLLYGNALIRDIDMATLDTPHVFTVSPVPMDKTRLTRD